MCVPQKLLTVLGYCQELTNATKLWQSTGKDRNTNLTLCLCIMTPYLKAGTNNIDEHMDKGFWNFGTLQLYRSHSCGLGDGWEPPRIPRDNLSWLPSGADNISILNYTQYRTQLNFTTPKDNIFWTNSRYFSASSPNTRKYLLATLIPTRYPTAHNHGQIPVTVPYYSVTTWKTTILDDTKHNILANLNMCVITIVLIAELQNTSYL